MTFAFHFVSLNGTKMLTAVRSLHYVAPSLQVWLVTDLVHSRRTGLGSRAANTSPPIPHFLITTLTVERRVL